MASPAVPPLSGVRVIDLAEGPYQILGRYLADLGAGVTRVEPVGGSDDRRSGVMSRGSSLSFAVSNIGKQSVVVDVTTADGRRTLAALADDADIVLVSEG